MKQWLKVIVLSWCEEEEEEEEEEYEENWAILEMNISKTTWLISSNLV